MGGNSSSSGGGEGPANRYQKPPPPKKKLDLTPISIRVVKAVGKGLADAARPYNTRRRKEFISKYNTSVPPGERIDMTDEKIGSKEGLASLREVGYKTNEDIIKENRGNDNNQVTQTTQVPKTILSPTTAEVSQSEAANAVNEEDPLYLRKKKTKAKGRSQTILTSSRGVTTDEGLTLGKKSLLGA
jgi:hypothetical protein